MADFLDLPLVEVQKARAKQENEQPKQTIEAPIPQGTMIAPGIPVGLTVGTLVAVNASISGAAVEITPASGGRGVWVQPVTANRVVTNGDYTYTFTLPGSPSWLNTDNYTISPMAGADQNNDDDEGPAEIEVFDGYRCPCCEDYFVSDDYDAFQAWYCGYLDGNLADGETVFYAEDEPAREWVWKCGDGCFNHDEGDRPKIINVYECPHCNARFDNERDARRCC